MRSAVSSSHIRKRTIVLYAFLSAFGALTKPVSAQTTLSEAAEMMTRAAILCGASFGTSTTVQTGNDSDDVNGSVTAAASIVEDTLTVALEATSRNEQIDIVRTTLDELTVLPEGVEYNEYQSCIETQTRFIFDVIGGTSSIPIPEIQLSVDMISGGNTSRENFGSGVGYVEDDGENLICHGAEFYFEYPRVSGHPDLLVQSRINGMVSSLLHIDDPSCADEIRVGELKFNRANLLSIRAFTSVEPLDAALVWQDFYGININVVDGNDFHFRDLFVRGFEQQLVDVVNTSGVLVGPYGDVRINDSEIWIEISVENLDGQDFYVDEHMLHLLYPQRTLTAASSGPVDIAIDLRYILDIADPDGPLSTGSL